MPAFRYIVTLTSLTAFLLPLMLSGGTLAQDMSANGNGSTDKPPSAADGQTADSGSPQTIIGETEAVPEEEPREPERSVIISLTDQMMWVFEDDSIIQRFPVSTGVPAHRTPTGSYRVHNKAPRAYSNRYECWMLQWQAITPDGMIGMHSLEGTSYLRRLGSVASHGCIRLSHENAQWLYDWSEIGTPVDIVADWEEPQVATSDEIVYNGDTGSEYFYW
jgi:hypothetical protein